MPSEEDRMAMTSPGQKLSPESVAAIAAIRAKMEQMREGDSDKSCHETLAPLAVSVNRLIKQRDELCGLCGEILATSTLPANQEQVVAMGPQFPGILAAWSRRFEKHSGKV